MPLHRNLQNCFTFRSVSMLSTWHGHRDHLTHRSSAGSSVSLAFEQLGSWTCSRKPLRRSLSNRWCVVETGKQHLPGRGRTGSCIMECLQCTGRALYWCRTCQQVGRAQALGVSPLSLGKGFASPGWRTQREATGPRLHR